MVTPNKNHLLVYRFLWIVWIALWVVVPFRLIRPLFFDKFIYRNDPRYGYNNTCSGKESVKPIDFNRNGYRDDEFYSKKSDEFLILMIGDSWVYGEGLKKKDRFTDVLEKKLNVHRKTQIFNLGECGSNIYSNLMRAKEFTEKLHPDLVIFELLDNDLLVERNLSDVPEFLKQKSDDFVLNPSYEEYEEYKKDRGDFYSSRVLGSFDSHSKNFAMFSSLIPQFSGDKTFYYYMSITPPNFIYFTFKRLLESNGFYLIDNFDLLSKYARKVNKLDHRWFEISKMEAHPNTMANRMFAERLYQEITSNPQWGFTQTSRLNLNRY